MNSYYLKLTLVLMFLGSASNGLSELAPPDTRSWEQGTADFIAQKAQHPNDGIYDGQRLKELDSKRAVTFLMPLLAKKQPIELRIKAVGALGWMSFQEAIPALSAIAKDATENEDIRVAALNPGLRYMKNLKAEQTAAALAVNKSELIRAAAYWVLSQHGTDSAIDVLEACLRASTKALDRDLIRALSLSKHKRAGKIIFDHCDFAALRGDEQLLWEYSMAMEQCRPPEAQQNMLSLAKQLTHPSSAYCALLYFGSLPRDDVVPALLAYIESDKRGLDVYEPVMQFIKSPKISDKSKKKLSELVATGQVKKIVPIID